MTPTETKLESLAEWCQKDAEALKKAIYASGDPKTPRTAHLAALFDTREYYDVGLKALAAALTEDEWDDLAFAWYSG